jgi:hypothetical protein
MTVSACCWERVDSFINILKQLTLVDKGNHIWPVGHIWVKPDEEEKRFRVRGKQGSEQKYV